MFRLSVLIPALLLSFHCRSQVLLQVSVVDRQQQALPHASVDVIELGSRTRVSARTDAQGVARVQLREAGQWQIWINGQKLGDDPLLIDEGETGEASFLFTYNPVADARKKRQSFDRRGLTGIAATPVPVEPKEGYNLIRLEVRSSEGRPQPGRRVTMVDLDHRRGYSARTDAGGSVAFHLPGGIPYDIDVEEHLNAAYLLMEGKTNFTIEQTVTYDTYQLNEQRKGDTITQHIPGSVPQKASRALFRIGVQRNGRPWKRGRVFLDEIGSTTVYSAQTDSAGQVHFVLPFGKKFLVQFPYQRDVDVVNLADARQQAWGSLDLNYQPRPELEYPERFLPKPEDLWLLDYPYFHRTPYRAPQATGPFLETRTAARPKGAVLELGIGATPDEERAPKNLSFVLDISGSMEGHERLESLKRGLGNLIALLREDDRISIILYNDRHQLLLPAQRLGHDRQRILELVNGISAHGGTNMYTALQTGYAQLMQHDATGQTNLLVLMTDGYDANPTDTLVALQRPYRNRVHCVSVGVGRAYNVELLRRLASAPQGSVEQAREGRELEALFTEKLLEQGAPAAREASVKLTVAGDLQLVQAFGLSDLRSLTTTGEGVITARLPDLYRRTDQPVLLSFALRPGATSKERYPLTIEYHYTDVRSGNRRVLRQTAEVALSETSSTGTEAETRKMYAIACLNACLTEMAQRVQATEWAAAGAALQRGRSFLREQPDLRSDADIKNLVLKLDQYEQALRRSGRLP